MLFEVTSSAPAKTSEVGGEAIKLAQTDRPLPKYFATAPPKLEAIAAIDEAAALGAAAARDRLAPELCGDFFLLCMALKRRSEPPSAVDANFDLPKASRLFAELSTEASELSLKAIAGLAERLMSQGLEERGRQDPPRIH